MSFPIPVNMTVSESVQQYGFSASETDIPVDFEVATPVVASNIPDYEGPYSVTPSESAQTLETDGKAMTDDVTVGAIPSDYVGSSVPRKTSADLTASGPTVAVPAGYYSGAASKTVQSGSASTPNTSIPVHMDVSLSATGLITAEVSGSQSVTPNVVEGYVDRGTTGTVSVYSLKKVQLPTQAAKTVTPTETEQTAVAAKKYTIGEVKVAAIPSDYIGSDVPQKSSSDLTASGATVTAPAGYYSTDAQKTIPDATYSNNITIGIEPYINVTTNGLIGVSKDEVSALHPVTSGGYAATTDTLPVGVWAHNSLQLDTQAGTTITPTEQEQTAVAAQKYTTGEVKVGAISSSYVGSGVARNDSTDLSVSGATVTAPAGYYENAASASVPNATWKNASTVGVVPDISVDSTGLITANCAGWTSIHPLTASGYADSDTTANIQLSGVKTSQLSTQAAQTITPTTTNQTIASGKYLTGAQTILGDANLVPESIVENITIFGVTGNAPPPVTVVHLI